LLNKKEKNNIMGTKHLKSQNPGLSVNFIDLISKFDPTPTKKITPFLLKVFKDRLKEEMEYLGKYVLGEHFYIKNIFVNQNNLIEKYLLSRVLYDIFRPENIEKIPEFTELLERDLIENNDITTYKNFDEMSRQISMASVKSLLKMKKKDIIIVHDDEEWLFIKPMTHEASVTYGYGTKWCTSMINEPHYFYKHSSKGVLIYVINKKNKRKFGVYSDIETKISIYNEKDDKVDSYEMDMNRERLDILVNLVDFSINPNNYELFSEDEKQKSRKHFYEITPEQRWSEEAPMVADEPEMGLPLIERIPLYRGDRVIEMMGRNNTDDLP